MVQASVRGPRLALIGCSGARCTGPHRVQVYSYSPVQLAPHHQLVRDKMASSDNLTYSKKVFDKQNGRGRGQEVVEWFPWQTSLVGREQEPSLEQVSTWCEACAMYWEGVTSILIFYFVLIKYHHMSHVSCDDLQYLYVENPAKITQK